ncbi:hypothetical protein EX238_17795, partial [Providencia rettgeri]|nr:hypothetical protein [Providencia rettgeri]
MDMLFKGKNKVFNNQVRHFLTRVAPMVFIAITHLNLAHANNDSIAFNTDVLDIQDRTNISFN